MKSRLTLSQFCEKQPAYNIGAMNNLVHFAASNGFDDFKVIARDGKKVLIDPEAFELWLLAGGRNQKAPKQPRVSVKTAEVSQ